MKGRRHPTLTERARAMRHEGSDAEALLWRLLRGRRLSRWKFRRQHPLGPFVLDFYCAAADLVVELDGAQHGDLARHQADDRRTRWLMARGLRVLRFWNDQVREASDAVLEIVLRALEETPATPGAGHREEDP